MNPQELTENPCQKKVDNNKEKVFTSNFIMLLAALFLGIVSLTALLFVLPIYLVSIGGSEATAGVATGIFTFSSIGLRPVLGRYIDKYGCKKILMLGMGLYCASAFLYIFASIPLTVYMLRALQGIGWGAFFVSSFTLAAELAPSLRQGEVMGYFTSAPPIGMAVGPVVGEYLFLQWGFNTAFVVSTLIAATALTFSFFFKEGTIKLSKQNSGSFVSRAVLFPSTIVFMINVSLGAIITFLPLLSQARNITNAGLFFTVYGVIVFLTRPFGGRAVDRYGYRLIVLPSLASLCLAMIVISFMPNVVFLIIAAALFGLGLSLSFPALMSLAITLSPQDERGRAMATFTSAIDLGIGLGSMGLGFVLVFTSYSFIYLICAVITIAGFAVMLRHRQQNLQE